MWGESSQNCENNCQCSGLITDNFKINSGNNATKRKKETALQNNYQLKMNPQALNFSSPIHSPKATPSKRRVLGELQNFGSSSFNRLKNSPTESPKMNLNNSPMSVNSPLNLNSPLIKNSPLNMNSPLIKNSSLNMTSPMVMSPLASLISPLLNSPMMASHSPITSRIMKKTSKINKIFEERTRFKENKENESSHTKNSLCNYEESYKFEESTSFSQKDSLSSLSFDYKEESYKFEERTITEKSNFKEEGFLKFDLEETARDFSFGERFQASRERTENWSSSKLDFTDALLPKSYLVPESREIDDLQDLQDLEAEFENESFENCTKYEIISTDSPNVISRGRSTTRKICSRNFEFGAPIADSEASTSFNRPATRMLNFDDEDFEFTSPAIKKAVSVKKSLKFNETPTKNPLRHERSDSSIGSMSSPASSKLSRVFTSESTTSMESGFISELEDMESNSPKIANFNDLLSGQIKENIITDRNFLKRPTLSRSLSLHPESKARVSLLSILESPSDEKRKRELEDDNSNKRRRSEASPLEKVQRLQRPVLQRALSENNASIKSALARSSLNADLIGDYTGGYSLPLTQGDHEDLKSISCETLAQLLQGEFQETVPHYQVIDCRYPYEFDGGHISSAVNVFTAQQAQGLVQQPTHEKRVLIFHCEFSIERGPKLSRTLRSFDRSHNKQNYPALTYPELYLLQGGYRAFHRLHPELCTPGGYTPMLDPQHRQQLRRHRSSQGKSRLLM